MPSLKIDAAQAAGYLRLEVHAGVTALAEWDLVREEICMQTRGVAGGTMGSAAVREHVHSAMEVGATTLGAVVRVNWSFCCAMGDTTLGDLGLVKLTFLGVVSILGDLGVLGGLITGEKGGLGMETAVGSPVGLVGGWKGC
jgi:hypothetical protein